MELLNSLKDVMTRSVGAYTGLVGLGLRFGDGEVISDMPSASTMSRKGN